MELSDFPGGPVFGCPAANAGDMGLTLALGRPRALWAAQSVCHNS